MFLNNIDNCFELPWNQKNSYRSIRYEDERQFSKYYFEEADVKLHFSWFEEYEKESARLLESELWLPAYDYCLKCSHAFNVLDARGAISVSERARMIQRVRNLACKVASLYLRSQGEGSEVARMEPAHTSSKTL